MSLEIIKNQEPTKLSNKKVKGYESRSKNFTLLAEGREIGGVIFLKTNEGQPDEKKIRIDLKDGNIKIPSLDIEIKTR